MSTKKVSCAPQKSFAGGMLACAFAAIAAAAIADPVAIDPTGRIITFDVDEADYPESAPFDYTATWDSVAGTVTNLVKRGTGSVMLGTDTTVSEFRGVITVEANGGFLMGWKSRFGRPTTVTVRNGGAIEFTEESASSSGNAQTAPGSFNNTYFYVEGSGPDGHGALQRPNAYNCMALDFFRYITLTGPTTINLGSRWGIRSGTLDMGGFTLTFKKDKHNDKFSDLWSPVFDISGTIMVKDPGEIVLESGRLGFEAFSGTDTRLVDAENSNGTISNMVIRAKSDSTVRIFGISDNSIPCKLVTEGTAELMVNNVNVADEDREKLSVWDGPIEIHGPKLNLSHYDTSAAASNASFVLDGPVSGGLLDHSSLGYVFMRGSNENVLGSIRQASTGTWVLEDRAKLHLTNSVKGAESIVGGTSSSSPATLIVKDDAQLTCQSGYEKSSAIAIGSSGTYGILKMYDNAVVSNDVSFGFYSNERGACYLFGGKLTMLTGARGGSCYIGQNGGAYGYLGIDGGVFAENSWFYLGSYTPGFIVQRAGQANYCHSVNGCPMRIANTGDNSYGHVAQLGGTSEWKGYIAMNFNDFAPKAASATAVVTVSGTNTLMDMSDYYIRAVAGTNAAKHVTALVNINDGGRLKTRYIGRESIYSGSATPAWTTISNLVEAGTHAYINFNGGVLITSRAGNFWNPTANVAADDVPRRFTRATVYEKGVTIDTDGKDVTWFQPLLKPYGHGIKSITLPEEARAANVLLGPSRCFITSSAGGEGADALVDFDDTNRVARGMIITSRGFGYEATPTVKLHKADVSYKWDCTVETVDFDDASFAHGGLTKRGAGTLTIACTNTYGGATRLEGGTLAFTHPQGYPGGDLELEGGVIWFASGDDVSLSCTVRGSCAALFGGNTRIMADHRLDLSNVRFEVTDPENLPLYRSSRMVTVFAAESLTGVPALAENYGPYRIRAAGNTVRFGCENGTIIMFR